MHFLAGLLLVRFHAHGYNSKMPSQPKERRRTEQRNGASKNLDRMTAKEIVRLMNHQDRTVADAVGQELPAIARAVDAVVEGIRHGGRLIYIGAGSSGRMAVLDAAECPPTFGTSPKLVQALIAGGRPAVTGAVEGAEDSVANGLRDLGAKQLTRHDVVVGITASGTTPYVLAALKHARRRGATTVAITVNPRTPVARLAKILIATRLKAGTSQKMVLNMLSTAAMARLGHVYENLMIDVKPSNQKVSDRIRRILAEASGKSLSAAEHALRQAGHNMRVALVMLKLELDVRGAKKKLAEAKGDLREALGE